MSFTKFHYAILSTAFTFVSCNKADQKHIYKDTNDSYIVFEQNDNKPDRFILKSDHFDFDGESIEMYYKGEFVKDSVENAVTQYLNKGILPIEADLQ